MATKLKVNYEFVGDSTTPVTRTNSIKHGDSMLSSVITSAVTDLGNKADNSTVSVLAGRVSTNENNIANLSNYVTPEMFGAVGDGVTDDTDAMQSSIDAAISNNKALILNKTYLCATLLINGSLLIKGTGTIKQFPKRIITATSSVSAGGNTLTLSEKVHKNAILTIITNTNTEIVVVTAVDGNTVTIAPYKLNCDADQVSGSSLAISTGDKIHVENQSIILSKRLDNTENNDDEYTTSVNNVTINGITFKGNRNSSDAEFVVYDAVTGGAIIGYRSKNVTICNCKISEYFSNSILFYGRNRNINVFNNVIENVLMNQDIDELNESAGAICAHWDMRTVNVDNVTKYINVYSNVIVNCRTGIFLSGTCYGKVFDNDISNVTYTGIMLYFGDSGLNAYNLTAENNCIHDCPSNKCGAIKILGATYANVNNNIISDVYDGISSHVNVLNTISNNFIGVRNIGIDMGRSSYSMYSDNRIMMRGAGQTGYVGVQIDNTTISQNESVTFKNNQYFGSFSAGVAVLCKNETADGCFTFIGEVVHGSSPLYESSNSNGHNHNFINCVCMNARLTTLVSETFRNNFCNCIDGQTKTTINAGTFGEKPSSDITSIQNLPNGSMKVDSTNKKLKICFDNVWHDIETNAST